MRRPYPTFCFCCFESHPCSLHGKTAQRNQSHKGGERKSCKHKHKPVLTMSPSANSAQPPAAMRFEPRSSRCVLSLRELAPSCTLAREPMCDVYICACVRLKVNASKPGAHGCVQAQHPWRAPRRHQCDSRTCQVTQDLDSGPAKLTQRWQNQ